MNIINITARNIEDAWFQCLNKVLITGYEYTIAQMFKVIEMYKHHTETNQACMTIGSKNSIDLDDPPCLRVVDTRLRYGKLHFIVYFRSWDLWAAFPTNLGGLQLMKEFMAGEIGCEDGEIIAVSKGLHLYDHAWNFARQVCRLENNV